MINFLFFLITSLLFVNLIMFPMCRMVDVAMSFMYRRPQTGLGVSYQEAKANLMGDSGLDAEDGWEIWVGGDLLIGFTYWFASLLLLCTTWFWWVPLLPLLAVCVIFGGRYYIDNYNTDKGTKL